MNYRNNFISVNTTIKHCLSLLGEVGIDTILFAVNDNDQLIGCVTDGDIRRGLLNDVSIEDSISKVLNPNPKFIRKEHYNINDLKSLRDKNYKLIPVLDKNDIIIKVINFRSILSYLPIDVVIMAGGLGSRLKPLTDKTPKPLLKIGDKAIIDYNIDRLISFGVDDFWISVRYLADQIKDHFKNRNIKNINFIDEDTPLGTIGAVSKINNFKHHYILVTNSDILTNLNYESFFEDFIEKDADMSVITIPYDVKIPYAVMETKNNNIFSFIEKPTYTYYSNGGIYLIKKSILMKIPKNKFYNATDLMNLILEEKLKLISYPVRNYWLDIGKHEDYAKAQKDIKQIKF
ncbi:MAG: nucleotidyltransferase family protein [Flavobacteriaceae bacterium]|nr:nucleotidyltransferase family protein [Flavobacteriaceae bacterium]